jgi:hypothetical protein
MAVIENEHVSLDSSSLAASALVLGRREVFIDAVNSRQLHQLRMPILRALLPEYVAKCELNWYCAQLLRAGPWRRVRSAPSGRTHVFDVYAS